MRYTGFFAVVLFWLGCILANVAFWGALAYIAVHFLRKFW